VARPRAPTFDLQRAAIVQAAARLFAAEGFPGASMARLAATCGISKPLLYHYYRDKAHILFDVADGYMDSLIGIVAEVKARRLEPEAHFRALVGRFMQAYQHSQAQHVVLVQDVKFLGDAQRETVIGKQRQVVDAFAASIAKLKPRWTRRSLRVPLAMILFGMINWTFTWLRSDGPLRYEDMAGVVADIFLNGVTAPVRAQRG
jgi:AcrR family transcriptional regulator